MDANKLKDQANTMIKDAASATQEAAEKTLHAAAETADAAGERLHAARHRAHEAIDQLSDRAQHYARVGLDKAHDAKDYARRRLQDAGDATCSYVEEQPLKSIAIAAGVGAVTAALLMLLRGRD